MLYFLLNFLLCCFTLLFTSYFPIPLKNLSCGEICPHGRLSYGEIHHMWKIILHKKNVRKIGNVGQKWVHFVAFYPILCCFLARLFFLHFTLFCYSLCLKNNSRKKYEICIFSFSCFLKCKAFVNLLTPKKLAPADLHFFLLLLFSIWPCWLFGSNFHASTFGQSAAMHIFLLFSLSSPVIFGVNFPCFEKPKKFGQVDLGFPSLTFGPVVKVNLTL